MVKKAKKEEVPAAAAAPKVSAEKTSTSKKSATNTPAKEEKQPKKEEKKAEDVKMSDDEIEESNVDEGNADESQTVREKKENAKKMLKAVKAFNAKLKSTIERKDITRAVQALQGYYKKLRAESAKGTKQLLESDDQFI